MENLKLRSRSEQRLRGGQRVYLRRGRSRGKPFWRKAENSGKQGSPNHSISIRQKKRKFGSSSKSSFLMKPNFRTTSMSQLEKMSITEAENEENRMNRKEVIELEKWDFLQKFSKPNFLPYS